MAGASNVRAGGAFVELFADKWPLVRGLNSAAQDLDAWAAKTAKLGAGLLGIGTGALAPLGLLTKEFAAQGAHLDDLSQITGISANTLSGLGFAASQSATDLDTVAKSISKMQGSLQMPSESADKTLASLGIEAQKWRTLSPEEQFLELVDAIDQIGPPSERAAAAIDVFGKSGAELLPFIGNGAAGIRALMQEAEDLAVTLSDEDASAAAALDDELDRLQSSIRGAGNAIGAALAPDLEVLAKATRELIVESVKWIRANPQIVTGAALIAGGAAAAGAGVLGLSVALKVSAAAATLAATAWTGIGTAITLLTSPAGIALAAIAGVAVGVEYHTGAISSSLAAMKPHWEDLKATAQDTLAGVKAAIQAGDIRLAAEILWAGIDVVWQRGVTGLKAKGLEWLDSATHLAREVKAGMILAISGAWDSAAGLYDSGKDVVLTIIDTLGVEVANKWDEIGQGVREAGALFVAAWKFTRDKLKGESKGRSYVDYANSELRETVDVTKQRREARTLQLTERTRRRDDAASLRSAERAANRKRVADELGNQLAESAAAQAAERRRLLDESNQAVTAAEKRLKAKIDQAKAAADAARQEAGKPPPPLNDDDQDQESDSQRKTDQSTTQGTTQAGVASRLFFGPLGSAPTAAPKKEKPTESAGRATGAAADAAMEAHAKLDALNQPLADNAAAWSAWSDAVTGAATQVTAAVEPLMVSMGTDQQINPSQRDRLRNAATRNRVASPPLSPSEGGFSDGNEGRRRQAAADAGADAFTQPENTPPDSTAHRPRETSAFVAAAASFAIATAAPALPPTPTTPYVPPQLPPHVVAQINPQIFAQSQGQNPLSQTFENDNSETLRRLDAVVSELQETKREIAALRQEGWS